MQEAQDTVNQMIIDGFWGGVMPFLLMFVVPLLLYIVLPGVVARVLLKRKEGYYLGAFIGMIALFTIGPFS